MNAIKLLTSISLFIRLFNIIFNEEICMRKQLLFPGLVVLIVFFLAGCGQQTPAGTSIAAPPSALSGTYEVDVQGFNAPYKASVTVDGPSITQIEIGENQETPHIGQRGLDMMAARMIEENTAGVDAISGATVTTLMFRHAVTDALRKAGAPEALLAAPVVTKKETQTIATDVLVIGGGGAGLSAAIAAARGGSDVILIEKQDLLGGSTAISAGIVYSALDQADEKAVVEYYLDRAEGGASEELLAHFAAASRDTIAFLEDIGVTWMFTAPSGTAPEPRAHFSTGFTGATLTDNLIRAALNEGVSIMTGVTGTALIQDSSGAVTGAQATSKAGDYLFAADAVILATGGFDASTAMKEEYAPSSASDFPLSNKGNTGDGITMGIAAGADTVFNGGMIGFVVVRPTLPHSGESSIAMASKGIAATDGTYLGQYVDYPIVHTLIKESGAEMVYGLLDSTPDASGQPGGAAGESAIAINAGYKGDTAQALAAASGMNAAKLTDALARSGLTVPPFYAVEVRPTTIGSMGGLRINTQAEVLDTRGNAIPGLYAAGEVANGELYYKEYPASGTSIAFAITYGLEAGRNAAAQAVAK